eukprot:132969_1
MGRYHYEYYPYRHTHITDLWQWMACAKEPSNHSDRFLLRSIGFYCDLLPLYSSYTIVAYLDRFIPDRMQEPSSNRVIPQRKPSQSMSKGSAHIPRFIYQSILL